MRLFKINGEWVSNPLMLRGHISNYFEGLFGRCMIELEEPNFASCGRGIDANRATTLMRRATEEEVNKAFWEPSIALMRRAMEEEVKKAVFGIKHFGKLGLDGI